MSTSTMQTRTRIALAVLLVVGLVLSLIWCVAQIKNLRREQAEQGLRFVSVAPLPAAPASAKGEPTPPAGRAPATWAEQLAEIRNETRAEIAKLQEEMRRRDPADAALASLREENKAELTRIREEMALSDHGPAKPGRDRNDEQLKTLREQVRVLDRRVTGLTTTAKATRSARRAAARRRQDAAQVAVRRAGRITVVYPTSRR